MKRNLKKVYKNFEKMVFNNRRKLLVGLSVFFVGSMVISQVHTAYQRNVVEKKIIEEELEITRNRLANVNDQLLKNKEKSENTIEEKIIAIEEKNQEIETITTKLNETKSERDELKKEWATRQKNRKTQQSSSQTNTGDWITFNASAYSTYANGDPYAGKQWGNKTSIGYVRPGIIAIPRNHPFLKLRMKVELKFPSGWEHLNGIYDIEDRFGAGTTGNRIDIYMDDYSEVVRWGRRDLQLRIIN